jgi:hypothetical protein
MHDGVLRMRGLSRAERALLERLELVEVYSDADCVEALRRVLADRCRLHPCLLPDNLDYDLLVREALSERVSRARLSPFSGQVWRRLCQESWDRQTYPSALETAVGAGLRHFVAATRRELESRGKAEKSGGVRKLLDRYDVAAEGLLRDPAALIGRLVRGGRMEMHAASLRVALDEHIPGSERHVP